MQGSERTRLGAAYRRFAEAEARGRSRLYERLSHGVAEDDEILDFLLELPRHKRQPNLLFAAVRHICGTSNSWNDFRARLLENREAVRALMLEGSTQTNEPGRCAALLPVLTNLPRPLALLEVGAAAGLCLLPDCYGYAYGGWVLRPDETAPELPIFPCIVNAATPKPKTLPLVAWRAGLDLDPIDISDARRVAWLETFVWPEQTERLARLRAAVRIAMTKKPRLVKGDLRSDLARLADEMPRNSTRVIFHTAVLTYVEGREERRQFARTVQRLCDVWVANEAPQVFPEIAARAAAPGPPGHFLLSVNGTPVAWTDPHGATLHWIA